MYALFCHGRLFLGLSLINALRLPMSSRLQVSTSVQWVVELHMHLTVTIPISVNARIALFRITSTHILLITSHESFYIFAFTSTLYLRNFYSHPSHWVNLAMARLLACEGQVLRQPRHP